VNAKIRLAKTADIGVLVDLENRSFSSDRISPRALRRLIASPSAAVIVAMQGQTLAGYALVLFRATSSTARLYSLAADPMFPGTGRALLTACEGEAGLRCCTRLRLEVRADNIRAINLYQRMAYSRFADRPGYYADGETALRFEKSLATPNKSAARLAGTAAA
jgi:ribosomal protein S18 acetylase RimI-like enzyme